MTAPSPAHVPAPRSEDLGDETEICGCEEAVALRARVEELAKQCDTWAATVAEKNRRLGNLAASHDLPRGPDVARIYALEQAIDAAIRDMLSGGHPFEKGVAKAINALRAAQKVRTPAQPPELDLDKLFGAVPDMPLDVSEPTLLDQVRAVVAIWEDAMRRDRCDTGNARMTDIADLLRGGHG